MATSHASGNVEDSPNKPPAQDQKSLEISLHDGLDRLEEFTLMLAFQGSGSQFEILSITPPATPAEATAPRPRRSNESNVRLHQAPLQRSA